MTEQIIFYLVLGILALIRLIDFLILKTHRANRRQKVPDNIMQDLNNNHLSKIKKDIACMRRDISQIQNDIVRIDTTLEERTGNMKEDIKSLFDKLNRK